METCPAARVADDLVVDVGDVHDVFDGDALLAEKAAQHIDVQEGAEVADVAVVVDGGPAGIERSATPSAGKRGSICPVSVLKS